VARGFEPTRQVVQRVGGDPERRMCLARRRERVFDADMELAASTKREPDAATRAQRLGLLDLLQAEQLAEEAARLRFAAGRSRELDVI
jgi:hypothetical protein